MKKYCSSLSLLALAGTLSAQPTLTAATYNVVVPESVQEWYADTVGFNPGAAGPGVIWDFSSWTGVYSLTATVSAPDPATLAIIPTCNAEFLRSDYKYVEMDVNGQTFLGDGNGTYVNGYSDPMKTLTYPFTYLSTLTDDYYASNSLYPGVTTIIEGSIDVIADGVGTLFTPTDTFGNVLRIRTELNYVLIGITDGDTTAVDTGSKAYTRITYDWVRPGIHFPLFSYQKEKGGTTPFHPVYVRYLNPEQITLDVPVADERPDNEFVIYPNPSGDGQVSLLVNCVSAQQVSVSIFDLSGKNVHRTMHALGTGAQRITIGTTDLARGIYLVELATSAGKSRQKLVIE